jgi:hypothetical protein
MQGGIKDSSLIQFIQDEKQFLQQSINNITETTNAVKPPVIQKEDKPTLYDAIFDLF